MKTQFKTPASAAAAIPDSFNRPHGAGTTRGTGTGAAAHSLNQKTAFKERAEGGAAADPAQEGRA